MEGSQGGAPPPPGRITWGHHLLRHPASSGDGAVATKAATWIADLVITRFGLAQAPAVVTRRDEVFLVVIHLASARATALASTMIRS